MTNARIKRWGRRDDETSRAPEAEPAVTPSRPAAAAPEGLEDEPPDTAAADLADVGVEVASVLKSAQESADRIRSAARADAAKLRKEAEAAATAEVEEARRRAAEAEQRAAEIGAEAEADAEQVRSDAERQAQQMLEQARLRVQHTDAEIEEKLRTAEGDRRRRRDALQAETERYEVRLERLLGVFHGMSAQLEELLEPSPPGGTDAGEHDPDEAVEHAVQANGAAVSRPD